MSNRSIAESTPDAELVERTAQRVYRALFRAQPPSSVMVRFSHAFMTVCSGVTPDQVASLKRAIDRVKNLSALETAARYTGALPLLVTAFRLMVYIAEAEPSLQHVFVKRRRNLAGALASLCLGAFETMWSFVLGLILLRGLNHA